MHIRDFIERNKSSEWFGVWGRVNDYWEIKGSLGVIADNICWEDGAWHSSYYSAKSEKERAEVVMECAKRHKIDINNYAADLITFYCDRVDLPEYNKSALDDLLIKEGEELFFSYYVEKNGQEVEICM